MVKTDIDGARRTPLPSELLLPLPAPGKHDAQTDNSFRDHLSNAGRPAEPAPREAAAPRGRSSGTPSLRKPQPADRSSSSGMEHAGAPPGEPRAEVTETFQHDRPVHDEDVAAADALSTGEAPPDSETEVEAQLQEHEYPLTLAGIAHDAPVQLATEPASAESTAEPPIAPISLRRVSQLPPNPDPPPPAPGSSGEGGPPLAPEAKAAVFPTVAPELEDTKSDQHGLLATETQTNAAVEPNQPQTDAETLETNVEHRATDEALVQDVLPEQVRNEESSGLGNASAERSEGASDAPLADGERDENAAAAQQASPTGAAQLIRSQLPGSAIGAIDRLSSKVNPHAAPAEGEAASASADHARQEHGLRSRFAHDPPAPHGQPEELPPPAGSGPANSHTHSMQSDGQSGAIRGDARAISGQAAETNSRDGLSEIDRVRLVQRVARAFHNLRDQGGQLRLRLSPPELGALRLDVMVRDGALTAHLEAETSAARTILLDNLPALRDRLAEQQIRLERFDVDLMDRPPGDPSQQPMRDRDSEGPRERSQPGPRTSQERRGGEAMVQTTAIVGETQLNVVI